MSQRSSRKSPLLAAGLTLLLTGLGQAYLRRWARAAAWVLLAVLAGWLFVPDAAITNPGAASITDVLPILAVGVLCLTDAYVLARQHNVRLEARQDDRCGDCYRELEGDLSFCPWCATELDDAPDGRHR